MNESKLNQVPTACVLACAGPVLNNTVSFTNIAFGWKIDVARDQASKAHQRFCRHGYGILTVHPYEYIDEKAPIASIGAGTALGECFLTPGNDGQYSCFASEGGHTDFAPSDEIEIELYNEIKAKLGCRKRFSVDRIVSGPGLATIYEFLATKFPEKVDPKLHEKFLNANTQQGKVVGENSKTNVLCTRRRDFHSWQCDAKVPASWWILHHWWSYTQESGLFYQEGHFLDSLFDKGRVNLALRACPIYLVLTEELGEHGAHFYAFPLLQSGA
ncbi:hypothetical protein PsorP6_015105 [Peronosclerospora sorghi]|uniref:Uncharacterized protein n=1 Tax=Peronosclerospora sorghi TaxID=230839 RepID=A0ACC0VVB2_9STRA|nr:hypothetical protein PsorP6_015105 [Peronosclerospora sorghi]